MPLTACCACSRCSRASRGLRRSLFAVASRGAPPLARARGGAELPAGALRLERRRAGQRCRRGCGAAAPLAVCAVAARGGPFQRLRAQASCPARRRPGPGAARAVAFRPAQSGDAAVRRRRPARPAQRRGERHAAGVLRFASKRRSRRANLAAVALLASAGARPERRRAGCWRCSFFVALAVKAVAFAILMRAEHGFAWLTPGAQLGLVAGLGARAGGAVAAAPRATGVCRGAAHGCDGAGQPCAAEPLSCGNAQSLGTGTLPQLQRPHSPGVGGVAVRGAGLPGLSRLAPAARTLGR